MALIVVAATLAIWQLRGSIELHSQLAKVDQQRKNDLFDAKRRILEEEKGMMYDHYISDFEQSVVSNEAKKWKKQMEETKNSQENEKKKQKEIEDEVKKLKETNDKLKETNDKLSKEIEAAKQAEEPGLDTLKQVVSNMEVEKLSKEDRDKLVELQGQIASKLAEYTEEETQ